MDLVLQGSPQIHANKANLLEERERFDLVTKSPFGVICRGVELITLDRSSNSGLNTGVRLKLGKDFKI